MTSKAADAFCIIILDLYKGGLDVVDAKLIGSVIRCYRKERHMSQELLSGLAGLDRTHYSKIERGLRSPTIETLFRIAGAIDVPPHMIIETIEKEVEKAKVDV